MSVFVDKLLENIKKTNNPSIIGLDPAMDFIPGFILEKYFSQMGKTLEAAAEAVLEFNIKLIDAIYDIVPAIKPQSAYYEALGYPGIKTLQKTIEYAKTKGLLVVLDVKRNDIGSTAAAYSNAYLGTTTLDGQSIPKTVVSPFGADAVTVNPYLGYDGIKPFIDDCKNQGKGLFILVKTSNPSSAQLQDLKLDDGKQLFEKVGELVDTWGKEVVGTTGYSSVGAVVGATYPEHATALRRIMPKAFILVPGYGAQGGSAADAVRNFNDDGFGAIVNASRSVMCAHKAEIWKETYNQFSFDAAARSEAIRMRDDLNKALENRFTTKTEGGSL